jgi:hypothetical protein
MPSVERRTFLIGLASLIASPAIASAERFTGPIAVGELPSPLKWRKICDLIVSSMPTAEEIKPLVFKEEPVRYTMLRDDEPVYVLTINPRATFRWVPVDGGQIVIQERSSVRILVEPCHTITTINIVSDIEKDPDWRVRRKMFSECYRWRDGKLELVHYAACNPADAHILSV